MKLIGKIHIICATRRHIKAISNSGNPEGSRSVHKETMRNDVRNQGSVFGPPHKCGTQSLIIKT